MVLNTTQYDAVEIQEYMGKYSISALKLVKGQAYPVWAKYQKTKTEFQEKSWPVKVNLGEREQAIATLKTIIAEIEQGLGGGKDIMF